MGTDTTRIATHFVAGAFTSLWVAAADIGELVFTRWLYDGAGVALACGLAHAAALAGRVLRRAARNVARGAASGR